MNSTSSMFTLQGKVIHVFETPEGVNKDTGETYGGTHKVQILGSLPLKNGANKMDMVTLGTEEPEVFRKLTGSDISVPIGFFPSKGSITYFIPKTSQPSIIGLQKAISRPSSNTPSA